MINVGHLCLSSSFSQMVEVAHDDAMTMIRAVVQPAGQEELLLLPEGQRFFPSISLASKEQLDYGDLVFFEGRRWRVVNVADWRAYGYYSYVATRYEGTEAGDSRSFGVTERLGS